MNASLTFNDIQFSVIDHSGQPWLKSSEIAKALGYSDERSVSKIFQRNADEFSGNMTQVVEISEGVNLTTSTRIFSLRGCHLVAMFARTKIAKSFRRWVLDVLDSLNGEQHPAPATLTPSTAEDRKPLNALISAWIASSPLSYRGAWAQIHAHFNITKAADLPKEWLPDVIAFVQERMDSAIAAKPVHSLPSSTPAIDEYKRHVDNVLVALTLFRSNVVMDAQLEAGAKRLSRRDLWPIQQALFDAIGANAAAIESSKRLMDVAQQVLMQQM